MPGSILAQIGADVLECLRRRKVTGDAAADAFHDALVGLYAAKPALDGPGELTRWLSTAAVRAVEEASDRAVRGAAAEAAAAPMARTAPDVAEVVERRLVVEAAVSALDGLRPADRALVRAAMDGCDRHAALPADKKRQRRVRLHRARQRLRNRLRGWLAGLPVPRLLGRRGPAPPMPAPTALGLSLVAVIGVVSVVGNSIRVRSDGDRLAAPPTQLVVALGSDAATTPAATPPVSVSVQPPAQAPPVRPVADARPAGGGPPPPERIVVAPVPGSRTAAGAGDRQPGDDSLACYGNVPLLGSHCVEHPVRGPLPGL